MSELSIYIVEDEALYANQLTILVDKLGYELAGIADNSDTAKSEIERLNPDLLLVDIKINGSMNGIDLVSTIKKKIPVIFITSFADQATFDRAKQLNPYAYITKPFDDANLQRTIELAFSNISGSANADNDWQEDIAFQNTFFIKNRNKLEKVTVDEIRYLEVEDRHSTVYTDQGRKYVLRMSMADLQKKLPEKEFFRVHRKYSVNLKKVTTVDTQDNLLILGDVEIPISRSHKEELLKRLNWMQ